MKFLRNFAKPSAPKSEKSGLENPTPGLSSASICPTSPTIEALEQRMAAEAVLTTPIPVKPAVPQALPVLQGFKRGCQRLLWTGIFVSIPVGAIALINLPYSPVRRPIAESAPMLLMPSYISMDQNYRQALANVEAAKQLIDGATAPADLELGEQKVKQAQANLDQLPTWVWNELPNTGSWWWYSRRLSRGGLDQARAEIGRLQGKVFQEKNAQTALAQAEQMLKIAEQQYKAAKTPLDQQIALNAWQAGLDQMQQVPADTLAGKMVSPKSDAARRDFQLIGGLITNNQQSQSLIQAAKAFSLQAAQASQNAPHSVTEWQKVLDLRSEAIQRLKQVSPDDPIGYAEAQKLMATYIAEQGQIRVRQQRESDAVQAYSQARSRIEDLISSVARDPQRMNPADIAGRLENIIRQLESVDTGTTVYAEAQDLLISAKQKLKEWKIQ